MPVWVDSGHRRVEAVRVPYLLYLVIQCFLYFHGVWQWGELFGCGVPGGSLIREQARFGGAFRVWLVGGSTEGSRCLEFDLGMSMGLLIFRIFGLLFGASYVEGEYIPL